MNENEISRIAASINSLRPDWPTASLRTLIADKLGNRPRRDVAVALTWVACESDSKTPARVLEAGPWWRAAALEGGAETITHTGKTVGLRHGDPRTICGICDMWRADCEQRQATSGHDFVPRSECLPPTEVGPLGERGTCLAGPATRPCQLKTGHDGSHQCPPADATPVAHLRALRNEAADDLCSHGVKRANCLDHIRRDTEPETDQPEES